MWFNNQCDLYIHGVHHIKKSTNQRKEEYNDETLKKLLSFAIMLSKKTLKI